VTVKEILGNLSVADVYKIAATVITAMTGAFGIGFKVGQTIPPAGGTPTIARTSGAPINCGDLPGYPKGRWMYSGRVTSATEQSYKDNPLLGGYITVTSSRHGTWLAENPVPNGIVSSEPAFLEADQDIQPNLKSFSYTSHDPGGDYSAKFQGSTTPSGCSIRGTFKDNHRHSGELTYFWIAALE
jgi:hypothetical protein